MQEVEEVLSILLLKCTPELCHFVAFIMVLLSWHFHCSGPRDFCPEKALCSRELTWEKSAPLPRGECTRTWNGQAVPDREQGPPRPALPWSLVWVRFSRQLWRPCKHWGPEWTLLGECRRSFKEGWSGKSRCLGIQSCGLGLGQGLGLGLGQGVLGKRHTELLLDSAF